MDGQSIFVNANNGTTGDDTDRSFSCPVVPRILGRKVVYGKLPMIHIFVVYLFTHDILLLPTVLLDKTLPYSRDGKERK